MLVAAAVIVVLLGWRILRRRRSGHARSDPYRISGIATRSEVAHAASRTALMRRARHLRPPLAKAKADRRRVPDRDSREARTLGERRGLDPRSSARHARARASHIVINAILDAPGAVVTTSTRPDNLTATIRARARIGPVAVFDPQQLAEGVPAGPALVADPRLRGPAHRDDPRRRPRLSAPDSRPAASKAAGSGKRRPAPRCKPSCTPPRSTDRSAQRTVPLDTRPGRRVRRGRDPRQRPRAPRPAGPTRCRPCSRPTPEPATPSGRASPWRWPHSPTHACWMRCLPARASLRPRRLPPQQRHPLPPRDRRRREQLRRAGRRVRRGRRRDRPPHRGAQPGRSPRPAAPARPRRDRQPRPAAVPADADGRGRRHRDHHDARPAVARPGARQMERQRRRRDLGRLDRQDHPRRRIQLPRPPRPLHPHRRTRRGHRLHHRRRPRLPILPALDPPRRDHAARRSSGPCRSAPASSCSAPRRRSSPGSAPWTARPDAKTLQADRA